MATVANYTHACELTGMMGPPKNAAIVTPDDGNDLSVVSRALYVGGTGNMQVQLIQSCQVNSANILLTNIPSGTLLPIQAARVTNANTTATGIISLW